MKGKNTSNNDSIFSVDYKIPYYSKDSIESHLEESQEEINFIKIKLTQAYQKLQFQIQANNDLEEQNQVLQLKLKELEQKYAYQKKENNKLKETLEVILKNRKIIQEENDEIKQNYNKKIEEKQITIQELKRENKSISQKFSALAAEVDEKERMLKDYANRLREESKEKEYQTQRQIALANKIQILEQQITRITEEKYIEVNRLRHQLQLYQRSTSPLTKEIKIEDEKKEERKRQFFRPAIKQTSQVQKFSSKGTVQTQFESNKENQNLTQINANNSSLAQQSVSKWKRHQSTKETVQNESISASMVQPVSVGGALSDDQQLTMYQAMRKKAQLELCALQKIKRPNNTEREKMTRLQREIYHLDSDIAGLKRKIRRKY